MKRKVLVLILIAGMLTSGLAANTFASDSNEDFVSFAEEVEVAATNESTDVELAFEDDGESEVTGIEESGDVFSDDEDFTAGTEISDADSSGDMQEPDQEVTPAPSMEPSPTLEPSVTPEPTSMPTFSLTYKSGTLKCDEFCRGRH